MFLRIVLLFIFFFFQAEDGIRDLTVTGVQTCALPICDREPKNLGEISYGDERIRQGIYSINVFPLSGHFMGVAFENVTDRKAAEQAEIGRASCRERV